MTSKFCAKAVGFALLAAGAASPAFAQPVIVADSGDSGWMLATSVLVLVAGLPGLMLLSGRARTAGAAVLIAAAIASLTFAVVGYSLAFGEGSTILGGIGNAMLADLADLRDGTTVPESVYALFELSGAVLALAIVAAGTADRARLAWFVPFAALWLLIVYVPVARWLWGGGWLAGIGTLDFAGGVAIFAVGGVATFVVGLLLRDRAAALDLDVGSDVRLAGLGLVWAGALALVGGAALGAGDDAASAMLDAQLAASAALLTGLALSALQRRAVDTGGLVTATLAGIAAVATGAGYIGAGGAAVIGIVAAATATLVMPGVRHLRSGVAGETFAAFGVGGIVGAVLFPVFVLPALGGPGLDEGTGVVTQLAAQVIGVLAVVLWTAVGTVIAALSVSMVVPMRRD